VCASRQGLFCPAFFIWISHGYPSARFVPLKPAARNRFPQDALGVKGKFNLSINGHPQMRETFKGFHHRHVSLPIRSQKAMSAPADLLIRNYQIPV